MRDADLLRREYIALAILVVIAASFFLTSGRHIGAYPEIAYLKERSPLTFDELSKYFSDVAEQKGARYAFDVLLRAPLPPNIDTHLLGHIVGDKLYAKEGVEGIDACTQNFRNACSHAIVIGVFTDFGEAGLLKIREACRKAPGKRGAYTMCFHGLGHGVFAYTGNDLARTARLCKKTGTEAYGDREYVECFGGAIMELVGGVGHDKKGLAAARARYFSPEDPFAPCDTASVSPELKPICYTYLTPNLFAFQGGNLGHPGEREFKQAFAFCERIPRTLPEYRTACLRGIGKELPTLLASRDIRAVDALSGEKLAVLHTWCALAGSEEGRRECSLSIMQSLFWGGENDPKAAVAFCGAGEGSVRGACFRELFAINSVYQRFDPLAREKTCSLAPNELRRACRDALNTL